MGRACEHAVMRRINTLTFLILYTLNVVLMVLTGGSGTIEWWLELSALRVFRNVGASGELLGVDHLHMHMLF